MFDLHIESKTDGGEEEGEEEEGEEEKEEEIIIAMWFQVRT